MYGAGSEWPKIERDGEQLKRPMSSNGLWWADDDEDVALNLICVIFTNCHRDRVT
jgi:hypothetical protein